jgi:hypothetical protein
MDQQGISLSDIKEGKKDRICRPSSQDGRKVDRQGQEAEEQQAEACSGHHLGGSGTGSGAKDVFSEKVCGSPGVSGAEKASLTERPSPGKPLSNPRGKGRNG